MIRLDCSWQGLKTPLPRPLRRYERLIVLATKHHLIAQRKLRARAISRRVETLRTMGIVAPLGNNISP